MAMWESFQSLGCGVCLRPVAKDGKAGYWGDRIKKYILPSLEVRNIRHEIEYMSELEKIVIGTSGSKTCRHTDVAWLNEPGHAEFQVGYIAVSCNIPNPLSLGNDEH